ncbi:hypothetical protein OG394_26120 [Kribbella sp. NBC_01245]|uniref:hypothetical protein n=1 Tax=Kribbella sp. NBC_01245 TaxID=2903578 RepID=UPI002E2BD49A|nr:hypothetical protein [Kribbella sp. NBC_01245]
MASPVALSPVALSPVSLSLVSLVRVRPPADPLLGRLPVVLVVKGVLRHPLPPDGRR